MSADPEVAVVPDADDLFGAATDDPRRLAKRAFVWGFPLVAAAEIRLRGTNPDDPHAPRPPVSTGAPVNAWGHARVPADGALAPAADLRVGSAG